MKLKEGMIIRWAMSEHLSEWLTQPVWEYVQEEASMVVANILFSTVDSENMCDQIIKIGKLLEARKAAQQKATQ